jgi:hypothetical protein
MQHVGHRGLIHLRCSVTECSPERAWDADEFRVWIGCDFSNNTKRFFGADCVGNVVDLSKPFRGFYRVSKILSDYHPHELALGRVVWTPGKHV